ncbi:putative sialate O-acetylesterase [Apostichopus japonicus]|uniref:Putative sialate O-acetylesterase n=1 Tax=Stichopus japonicus TaxID=307972 RepID=A0A2G8KE17_STIJA|nr:putative sialate O-acetylesterase [Apostichopus japonicus]
MASQSAPLLTVGEQGETVFDHEDGSQVEDMKQDPQCYSNARKRTIYRPTLLIFVMLILVFAYFLTYASYRPTMIFYESTTTSFLSSSDLNNTAGSLHFASYFSDHMVLQMHPTSSILWGRAAAGSKVTVYFNGKGYIAKTKPGNNPASVFWRVILDPNPPGGPYNISVQSLHEENTAETKVLQDVLFGDVWFCGGQSNMAFPVHSAFNASDILSKASNYPNIRLLSVAHGKSETPLHDLSFQNEPWMLPSRESLGGDPDVDQQFSAVCYIFGTEMQSQLGYPIGLISDSIGGTNIQAWSTPEVIKKCLNSSSVVIPPKHQYHWKDSCLWNSMVHPLLNFTIKGVLWYQGEANWEEPERYSCLFPGMVNDWRKKWYEGTEGNTDPMFPFGFVQVCISKVQEYEYCDKYCDFASLRWAQTAGYGYAPNPVLQNVFMAVSVDLPDPTSPYRPIHPRHKQDIAHRLYLGARALAYSETETIYRGPFPKEICDTSGHQIKVKYQFDNIKLLSEDIFEVYCSENTSSEEEEEADSEDGWIRVNQVIRLIQHL